MKKKAPHGVFWLNSWALEGNPIMTRWPSCLWFTAPTDILVKESDDLTLGQRLNVFVPQVVKPLLRGPGSKWLSGLRLAQYQGTLLEDPRLTIKTIQALNPASLLPLYLEPLEQDCTQTVQMVCLAWPDLQDMPFQNPDLTLFSNGSNMVIDAVQRAGAAVITLEQTVRSEALPPSTWVQRAELMALTWVWR